MTAAEGTRKKDLERLKASEEKGRALVRAPGAPGAGSGGRAVGADAVPSQESRISALERDHGELHAAVAQLRGRPGRTGQRPPGTPSWDEGGEDAQATSV